MKIRHLSQARIYQREYGELQLLCGSESGEMKTEKADFKLVRIRPGSETSHHYHLERESIFYVLAGDLVVKSIKGRVETKLTIGDTVIAEPGEDHFFGNVGTEDALMYEIESPPHDSSDKVSFDALGSATSVPKRPIGKFWRKEKRVKLKICGVKNIDTAVECHRLGVDAIGVHAIGASGIARTLSNCEWMPYVPQDLSVFLLTDSAEIGTLLQLVRRTGCDSIQMQGPQKPSQFQDVATAMREIGIRVVKTVSAAQGTSREDLVRQVEVVEDCADAVLIDSALYGGTGREHDWHLTRTVLGELHVPLIIAGGIGADNCGRLINLLSPYGVDVESKAEVQIPLLAGRRMTAKNFEVIKRLVDIVRR
jgi:phosphoribosylanthranilate isomerase